jgi:hypothetical protein
MAVTKKTNDYTGRKVDILAFDGAYTDGTFKMTQGLYGESQSSGKVCAGIQKLAQRWLIEFLTPLGSVPYLPARGCNFINQSRSGRLRTEADAFTAFTFARDKVAFNLRLEDNAGTYPDDEKYSGVELLALKLEIGSKLSLSVRIDSLAGVSRVFVVPLTVVPAR